MMLRWIDGEMAILWIPESRQYFWKILYILIDEENRVHDELHWFIPITENEKEVTDYRLSSKESQETVRILDEKWRVRACPDCYGREFLDKYRYALHRAYKHNDWTLLKQWHQNRDQEPFYIDLPEKRA